MPVYFDVSAAVHRRAGLGRYAESLARAAAAVGRRAGFLLQPRGRDRAAGRDRMMTVFETAQLTQDPHGAIMMACMASRAEGT